MNANFNFFFSFDTIVLRYNNSRKRVIDVATSRRVDRTNAQIPKIFAIWLRYVFFRTAM